MRVAGGYVRTMLLAALAGASAIPAVAQQPSVSLVDTAVLSARLLNESSGIVASRRSPGVLWTLNDSGNAPLLFATDSTGADLGYVRVAGARNIDWEDLSIGPCTRSEGTCLYVADIGDNAARRASVQVYVVPEVDPPTGRGDTLRIVSPEDTIQLTYPDRPHDAEAIAVIRGWLLLITKDRSGPAVLFRAPLTARGLHPLERVGDLGIRTSAFRGRIVTGAAVSFDERVLVVRTYPSLHIFTLLGSNPSALTDASGIVIPVVETQGEGVCFDAQGRLVLTGERGDSGHAILVRLRLTGMPTP